MTHAGWAGMFEEPSVSRRRARFSGFVQPTADCSSAVIRCEPTSDVPVASRLRSDVGGSQRLFRNRDHLAKLASTDFREENRFEANEDTFHLEVLFLGERAFVLSPCPWMPARPPSSNQPSRQSVVCLFDALAHRNPVRFRPLLASPSLFPAPLRCIRRRRRTRKLGSVTGSPERGRRSLEPRTS